MEDQQFPHNLGAKAMTTQYGAPLTGVQMQRLQDAGLRACGSKMTGESQVDDKGVVTKTYDKYHLPADHAAYTLLEAGWLDGRNVALWFGGEKAPDDWDGGVILTRGGYEDTEKINSHWWRYTDDKEYSDIIAYTRKAEGLTTHSDRVLADAERAAKRMGGELGQNELWKAFKNASPATLALPADVNDTPKMPLGRHTAPQPETVTIAKMTEAEAIKGFQGCTYFQVLTHFNLIKPEPPREERFWASQPNCGAHVTDDVKAWVREALEFERD